MSRPKPPAGKLPVSRLAAPLQSNPFAMLAEIPALQSLAPEPAPQKVPVAATEKIKLPKPVIPKGSRGRLILRRETKDRGGKIVVVVYGFNEVPGANAVLIADLARELKGKLGCGGSFDRQEIVLQGDRCPEVAALLETLGFSVRGRNHVAQAEQDYGETLSAGII